MLKWALISAVISAPAGILGFTGAAAGLAGVAKGLFVIFLIIFLVSPASALLGSKAINDEMPNRDAETC